MTQIKEIEGSLQVSGLELKLISIEQTSIWNKFHESKQVGYFERGSIAPGAGDREPGELSVAGNSNEKILNPKDRFIVRMMILGKSSTWFVS